MMADVVIVVSMEAAVPPTTPSTIYLVFPSEQQLNLFLSCNQVAGRGCVMPHALVDGPKFYLFIF